MCKHNAHDIDHNDQQEFTSSDDSHNMPSLLEPPYSKYYSMRTNGLRMLSFHDEDS